MPAATKQRIGKRVARLEEADRHDEDEGGGHRRAETLDAARRAALGRLVAEHDVADEERAVHERPEKPKRVARPFHVDQDEDAKERQRERREIAARAEPTERDADRPDELDRRDEADRQAVERKIESAIHHGEAGAEAKDQETLATIGAREWSARAL